MAQPRQTGQEDYELATRSTSRPPGTVRGNQHSTDHQDSVPKQILPDSGKPSSWLPFIEVPLTSARDHLANERVFLAYVRTSMALANFGVLILQLYRLKHEDPPPGVLGDYEVGVPIAAITLIMAIALVVTGAKRFLSCQKAMVASKIVGSGNVVCVAAAFIGLVSPDQLF